MSMGAIFSEISTKIYIPFWVSQFGKSRRINFHEFDKKGEKRESFFPCSSVFQPLFVSQKALASLIQQKPVACKTKATQRNCCPYFSSLETKFFFMRSLEKCLQYKINVIIAMLTFGGLKGYSAGKLISILKAPLL